MLAVGFLQWPTDFPGLGQYGVSGTGYHAKASFEQTGGPFDLFLFPVHLSVKVRSLGHLLRGLSGLKPCTKGMHIIAHSDTWLGPDVVMA